MHPGQEKGKTLLWASRGGLLEQVHLLLQTGLNDTVDEWGFSPAHLAAFYNHLEVLKALVDAGADITAKTDTGTTPLHCAAMQGHRKIAEFLLAKGSDPSWTDNQGRPASHLAASDNHCEVLQVLVVAGDDFGAVDENGSSVLHAAAAGGAHEAFEMLVRTQSDVIPWKNNNGWTPLHKAVVESSFETVKLVLDVATGRQFQDASFEIDWMTSDDGATPLILASRLGLEKVVELLLDHGANIHATDQWQCTALHSAVHAGHTEIVRTLIRKGADVNAKHGGSGGGFDAVLDAVHYGHADTLEALLEGGARISDTVTAEGYSVLHIAAYKGNLALLKLLIKMSLPLGIDSESLDGTTPLIIATGAGRVDSVQFLLDQGADISVTDHQGWTALHWAVNKNHPHIVSLLLEYGSVPSVESAEGYTVLDICFLSLKGKDLESMERLLVEDVPAWLDRDASRDGVKHLLRAAGSGKLDLITTLLENGHVSTRSTDEDGYTGLLLAAERGQYAAAKLLIEMGAEVNARNTAGETSLWLAAHYGHDTVVQALLESGADPNFADELGETPISAAAGGGHLQAVEILLAKDADINTRTIYGKSVLDSAAHGGHSAVMQVLLTHEADAEGPFNMQEISLSITQEDALRPAPKNTMTVKDGGISETAGGGNAGEETNSTTNGEIGDGAKIVASAVAPITHGVDNSDFEQQLVALAEKGMLAAVERLIKAGYPMEKKDHRGYLALGTAAVNGHVSVVRTLLDSGVDLNLRDGQGRTALWWAAYDGRYEVAKLLIDAGAELNIQDEVLQLSPLMAATYRGRVKVLKLLLVAGEKELTEMHGRSALGIAVAFGHVEVTQLLLKSGADVEHGPNPSRTPLTTAVGSGDAKIARLLLEAGATPRKLGDNRSLLCIAAQRGFEDVANLLLEYGAEVDHLSDNHRTPLFWAAAMGHEMLARILIESWGAQVSHRDESDFTALSYAKMQGHEGVASMLRHASRFRSDPATASAAPFLQRKHYYTYSPLSKPTCIRLMDLHPGQESDALSFDLYEIEMDYEPTYEALSYEWKDKSGTIPVLCCDRSLLITPNLKLALRRIRSQHEVRTLWIDAVCINQEDIEERTSQVKLMTRIYKQAKEVLMWLGEDNPEVTAAFSSIPAVLDIWHQMATGDIFSYSLSPDLKKVVEPFEMCRKLFSKAYGHETYNQKAASGATDLLGRSYFTRAWIYQELVLAGARGMVLCGQHRVSWRDFQQFMAMWSVRNSGSQARERDMVMLTAKASEMLAEGGIKDMGDAIQALTYLQCGDPRDKIFAVLGVVDVDWSGQLTPDYRLSVQQVYINAARTIIRTTQGVSFWNGLNYPKANRIPDLPSWVPDWTCINERHRELDDGAVLPSLFRQPMERVIPSLLDSQFRSTDTTLYADGYLLGQIAFSATMRVGEDIYATIIRPLVEGLASLGLSIFDPYPSPKRLSYISVLCRLLYNSSGSDKIRADQERSLVEFVAWKMSVDPTIPERSRNVPVDLGYAVRDFNNRMLTDATAFDQEIHRFCNKIEEEFRGCLRPYNNLSANAHHGMTLASCDLYCTLDGHLGISGEGIAESGLVLVLLQGFRSVAMMREKGSAGEDGWYEYVGAADILELDWALYQTVDDIPVNGRMESIKIM